jgi:putative ubiquitin-RnfH superfamily antitoxin RatB of RatAB toxin-antitoxin module
MPDHRGEEAVEVVYALAGRAWRVHVVDAPGMTVSALLSRLPALAPDWPEAAFVPAAMAVFGHEVGGETVLRAGDRLELLRALPNDPKAARRARAQNATPR